MTSSRINWSNPDRTDRQKFVQLLASVIKDGSLAEALGTGDGTDGALVYKDFYNEATTYKKGDVAQVPDGRHVLCTADNVTGIVDPTAPATPIAIGANYGATGSTGTPGNPLPLNAVNHAQVGDLSIITVAAFNSAGHAHDTILANLLPGMVELAGVNMYSTSDRFWFSVLAMPVTQDLLDGNLALAVAPDVSYTQHIVRNAIWPLPDQTSVYSHHGDLTPDPISLEGLELVYCSAATNSSDSDLTNSVLERGVSTVSDQTLTVGGGFASADNYAGIAPWESPNKFNDQFDCIAEVVLHAPPNPFVIL